METLSSAPPRRTIGVLGGMGPEATVDFMARVIALTPAAGDQDHIPMLVDNNPQVPDRQQAMRVARHGPVCDALRNMALRLETGGADFLVMPCNTAHAFVGDATKAVSIPFVSIIDVTIQAIVNACPHAKRIGLLATDACLSAGVYDAAVAAAELSLVLPDAPAQEDCMSLIFSVKGGDTSDVVKTRMATIANRLIAQGADAVIAGCTEIPLILAADAIDAQLISSTEMLAKRAVDIATGARPMPAG